MADLLQSEYNNLISFAKAIVKNRPQLLAEDIVHDAIEKALGQGELSIPLIRKYIANTPALHEKPKLWNAFTKDYVVKVCTKCKEVLPVGFFRIDKRGELSLYPYCNPCKRILDNERSKTPQGKFNNKKRQERFRKRKKEITNRRSKVSWQNNSKELTDAYIRKVICKRGQYTNDFLKLPENYHLIEEQRNKIKSIRENKGE